MPTTFAGPDDLPLLPPGPDNRLVRLLVQVVDQPEERARAVTLLNGEHWSVRPTRSEDQVTPVPNRVSMVVEMYVRGARVGARPRAEQAVQQLAARATLGLWVIDSALVRAEPGAPSTTYQVYTRQTAPHGLGWLSGLWRDLGGADAQRGFQLPGPPDLVAARAEAQRRHLGGVLFDPVLHDVRVVLGPAAGPGSSGRMRWQAKALIAGRVILWMLLFLACGAVLQRSSGAWGAVPSAVAVAAAWPAGSWLTANARPLLRCVVGGAAAAIVVFLGYTLAADVPPGSSAGLLLLRTLVLLLLGCCAYGCWLAVRFTWLSRNATFVAGGLLGVLPFVLPWVGNLLKEVYLQDGFGIPASSVPVASYAVDAAGLKPVLIGAALLMVLVGGAGWLRYFHQAPSTASLAFLYGPLICVVYVGSALLAGIHGASGAADRAAEQARAGRAPSSYFGIEGRMMCLVPTGAEPVPVFNGPLPTDHPVLVFGTGSDPLWAWDPRRPDRGGPSGQALSLPAAAVSVVPPRGAGCPAARH
ncbi:hypothetical protein [Streptacidiphilus cavernicola]|uniref:Uncharacterized protein n=1 Tax=Streptacidiphilus cavernicola TaxID=3342716 RepID=A0ABV6W0G1_9ACTN